MSSIHILVPTPSVPPTEEHVDDDEQAAPLALTWCCVYIVSILEKKTFSPSPSLSVCVSISLSPSPPLPLSRSPSLSKTPQTFSPLVPQVVSHPSRIHHRSRSNVCNVSLLFMLLFLCVLLVNENIRCSKTSERNGYLGKNEGEIKKKKEKKRRKKKKKIPSRPVRMVWPVKFPFVSKTGNMPCVWNLLVWLRKACAPHTRQYMGSFDSCGGRWHLVSSSASRVG